VGGWYGLRKGYRGRIGMYVPPVLEQLGLAEVERKPRNHRLRAICVACVDRCPTPNNSVARCRSPWRV